MNTELEVLQAIHAEVVLLNSRHLDMEAQLQLFFYGAGAIMPLILLAWIMHAVRAGRKPENF